ncbi:integrating conjugative element protein [Vibrio sp. MACH09]|uniref:TIGR03752 family integrating conjugative element protein n=1 Tax=Vibrio sp. MACH09 TaxID=3025122 RepID=UPI0027934B63|nr:TIGR03752 family integrating conjugative element protein [Vibrio sp. MACH09]GLO64073.1 integrating conjugative element protein [Vibrio sp. MACH09]
MNKRNRFLILLGGLALISCVVLMVNVVKENRIENAETGVNNTDPIIINTDDPNNALGRIGDTPEDTLRTLAANLSQNEKDKNELVQELENTKQTLIVQKHESERQIDALTQRLNEGLSGLEAKIQRDWIELQNRQAPIKKQTHWEELGIDSSIDGYPSNDSELTIGSGLQQNQHALIWIEPFDATKDESGKWMTPALVTTTNQTHPPISDIDDKAFDATQRAGSPVYSLHRGSVLSNAVSLTALMGRIPINGMVTSPYPYSMVVGADNLLANGFTLPDLQGAIVTGTVTGDWSLSCVRGVVESIDFIRTDGTILSYPQEQTSLSSNFDGENVKTDDLGFLADPNGNPCLSGIKISNAPQYLTTQGLLDAAQAAANAVAISQKTISVEGNTTTSSITKDATTNAIAEAGAATASTVSDYIRQRMGSTFDIVYVQPGIKAAIHLRKPVTLSIPDSPTRVRYVQSSQGAAYVLP